MARELAESLFDAFIGLNVDETELVRALERAKAKVNAAAADAGRTAGASATTAATTASTAAAARQAATAAAGSPTPVGRRPWYLRFLFGDAPEAEALSTAQRVGQAVRSGIGSTIGSTLGGGAFGSGLARAGLSGVSAGGGLAAGGLGAVAAGVGYATKFFDRQAEMFRALEEGANAGIEAARSGDRRRIGSIFGEQRRAVAAEAAGAEFANIPGIGPLLRYALSFGADSETNRRIRTAEIESAERASVQQVEMQRVRRTSLADRELSDSAFRAAAFDVRAAAEAITKLRTAPGPR